MEEKLIELLKELDDSVFISSTDSETGEVEYLKPNIQDLEGTIIISGEWDREDLKNILSKVFPSNTPENN